MNKEKQYKIKVTPSILKKLKYWWKIYRCIEDEDWASVGEIEKKMAKDTGIEDIEFFIMTGILSVGIGNTNRTMPLIQTDKLER